MSASARVALDFRLQCWVCKYLEALVAKRPFQVVIMAGSDKKRSNASCRGLGGTPPGQFPEIVSLTHF